MRVVAAFFASVGTALAEFSKDAVNPGSVWHLARSGTTAGFIVKEIDGQRRILTHVRGGKMGHGHMLS